MEQFADKSYKISEKNVLSGGFLSGGFLARGVFVQGVFVRGFMSGFFFLGVFVLIPLKGICVCFYKAIVQSMFKH